MSDNNETKFKLLGEDLFAQTYVVRNLGPSASSSEKIATAQKLMELDLEYYMTGNAVKNGGPAIPGSNKALAKPLLTKHK
jgi:hypothetical protein